MNVIKHSQGISDAEVEKNLDRTIKFFEAQSEAEEKGEHEFTCPLCGGHAHWDRSEYNNHLHTGCDDCKFFIIE